MPIHEYQCEDCNREFEELILNSAEMIVCPYCKSNKVKKLISAFNSPGITVSGLTIPEAGYFGSAAFNEKLKKGEIENPVVERQTAIKNFRKKTPLSQKDKK